MQFAAHALQVLLNRYEPIALIRLETDIEKYSYAARQNKWERVLRKFTHPLKYIEQQQEYRTKSGQYIGL